MSTTISPREQFRRRLAAGPLLADGAMGTLLFSRGVPQRASLDELVASRPELVGATHREYLEAGAELIETLTLGANRLRLGVYGLADRTSRLNRRAAQLAREAREVSGREALVGGSVGPLGAPGIDLGRPADDVARATFREQLEGLLEGGIDVVVLETFADLGLILLALEEARGVCDLPVMASLTFGEELALADGTTPERAAAALLDAGADVIGVNCGAGPVASLDALERIATACSGTPLSAMPNAGLPQRIEGQFVYAAEPDYLGAMTPRLVAAGARIVGGCCGTTPDHVRAIRAALDATTASASAAIAPRRAPATERRPTIVERAAADPRGNPPADASRSRPGRRSLCGLGRDRPTAQHPHRPDPGGGTHPARRRR